MVLSESTTMSYTTKVATGAATMTTTKKTAKTTRKEIISKVRGGLQPKSAYAKINWRSVFFVFGIPLAGFLAAPSTPLRWQTFALSAVCYAAAITGITAGKRPVAAPAPSRTDR